MRSHRCSRHGGKKSIFFFVKTVLLRLFEIIASEGARLCVEGKLRPDFFSVGVPPIKDGNGSGKRRDVLASRFFSGRRGGLSQ